MPNRIPLDDAASAWRATVLRMMAYAPGLKHKDRAPEWLYASYTLGFGLWLSGPWNALNPTSLDLLLENVPEVFWAQGFICIGTVHIAALIINGSAWWTPFVRTAAACLNFVSYGLLVVGITLSSPGSSGVFTYAYLVLGGLVMIIYRASKDAWSASRRRGTRAPR